MSAPRRVTLARATFVTNPSAPTVTPSGANNSVSYSYKIVGKDELGNPTAASTAGTTAAGATTQSGTNKNVVTWTDPAGAVSVAVYRTVGGLTQGLIGTVLAGVQSLADTGIVADGSTASSSNVTGVGTQGTVPATASAAAWVTGTFVATVQIQCTPDGTNWINVGSAFTAPGFIALPVCVAARAKETAYTSGSPIATVLYPPL